MTMIEVTYMALCDMPAPPRVRAGKERVGVERLSLHEYLAIYRAVGSPLSWDQRLRMPAGELSALLHECALRVYVLRDGLRDALGLCEFDRRGFPTIELKNFGLVPEAQGRGLGSWLLATALHAEWTAGCTRVELHTDTWDHPAAIPVYQRAGFRTYAVRWESAEGL